MKQQEKFRSKERRPYGSKEMLSCMEIILVRRKIYWHRYDGRSEQGLWLKRIFRIQSCRWS